MVSRSSFSSPALRGRGTAGRRPVVEGETRRCIKDVDQNTLQVAEDVDCRDAERHEALICNPPIASDISLRLISTIMVLSIDFDHEPARRDKEVERVFAARMLFAKVKLLLAAENSPEPQFGRRHGLA